MAVRALAFLAAAIKNLGARASRQDLQAVHDVLGEGRPVLMFPSGEVSRLRPNGIRDPRWSSGFLRFARRAKVPVLPIQVRARNSPLFYGVSMLNKPAATLLLPREMLRQHHGRLQIRIGLPISVAHLRERSEDLQTQIRLVRRQLYQLGTRRKLPLETVSAVAHPERRALLRNALRRTPLLGRTPDGKAIHLVDPQSDGCADGVALRELGRLREMTFRAVGEGTLKPRDLDAYDQWYRHLVLWDDEDLEVAGSYRLVETAPLLRQRGLSALYTSSLFHLPPTMRPLLEQGLELGRSFVQPRYWGSRSLDYLWHGIGAYLANAPQLRYLFGAVSLSGSIPERARALIVNHYRRHYPGGDLAAGHRHPYRLDLEQMESVCDVIRGEDAATDFRNLKRTLADEGTAVPTLFKQYSELCEPGGVRFLGFGVDPNFSDCVDGLVLVDLARLKPRKHQRYLAPYEQQEAETCTAA